MESVPEEERTFGADNFAEGFEDFLKSRARANAEYALSLVSLHFRHLKIDIPSSVKLVIDAFTAVQAGLYDTQLNRIRKSVKKLEELFPDLTAKFKAEEAAWDAEALTKYPDPQARLEAKQDWTLNEIRKTNARLRNAG